MVDIYESGEMYLETILLLQKKKGIVRAVDICAELGFAKSSVSAALSALREKEFLENEDGALALTEKGRERAERIYERHTVLEAYFSAIGVPQPAASEDACKIEHVISDETFAVIKRLVTERAAGGETL